MALASGIVLFVIGFILSFNYYVCQYANILNIIYFNNLFCKTLRSTPRLIYNYWNYFIKAFCFSLSIDISFCNFSGRSYPDRLFRINYIINLFYLKINDLLKLHVSMIICSTSHLPSCESLMASQFTQYRWKRRITYVCVDIKARYIWRCQSSSGRRPSPIYIAFRKPRNVARRHRHRPNV